MKKSLFVRSRKIKSVILCLAAVCLFTTSCKPKKENNKESLEKPVGQNTVIQIPETHFLRKNMWVVKAINLNRGKCIQIVNNFKQMQTVINKFKKH